MQNPPKPRRLQHVFPGQSFLIIFVGVLHSPHRRCAFRIVSTTLVYSQCHVVPLHPLRGRRERVEIGPRALLCSLARGLQLWRVTCCCLEHASQNSGFPAEALRASHLSVCDGKEAVPGESAEGDRGPRARAGPNQRAARDRLRTRSPRTPPDGPGSGSALRPAACTPSRSPARPGIFRQATELTKPQCDLFTALAIDPPKRIQELAATR